MHASVTIRSSIMNQSIIHVALVVRGYDEAIDFYCNKLHFKLVEGTYQPEQCLNTEVRDKNDSL
jgi:catechol 2,3-dioxygenase-like lactoylglutathione lyase family enzyme